MIERDKREAGRFSAECSECNQPIQFNRQPRLLQLTQCPHCDEIMIVVDNDPVEFCEALLYAFEQYQEY